MMLFRKICRALMPRCALVYFLTIGILKLNCVTAKRTSEQSTLYPKLVIFHLDRVIWKFTIDDVDRDAHRNATTNIVTDDSGRVLEVYANTIDVLKTLTSQRIKLGAISLSPNIELVDRLMYLLHLDKVIMFQEFFYGSKVNHIERIKRMCDIPYSEILYFDYTDHGFAGIEERGILPMKIEGENGLTLSEVERGFKKYREHVE
uniref:Uncharacterized protein n=1 Tax=Clastoptera arizonana TaxID=38151 RepID=A0A1B6ECG1_9HEMI